MDVLSAAGMASYQASARVLRSGSFKACPEGSFVSRLRNARTRLLTIIIGPDNTLCHQLSPRHHPRIPDRHPPHLLHPVSASIETPRKAAKPTMDGSEFTGSGYAGVGA